ncbi:protein At-4/1 isoform X1 [Coffea arabica]|uniref:Protein At-4/1 isoform X1 n=1 Tax=Coffea arabica TaxID=13443 RepID=A0A6P6SXE9_COFAR|nr:protein At-4/1-like isoform X1 [Coffea arabica]
MAAATSDEEMDSLLSAFDQIYDEFKNGISEIQSLQLKCNAEAKNREALEFSVHSLQSENERLTKLYTESLRKLTNKIELHNSYQSLKDELKRLNDEHLHKENQEYKNAMELLKQDHVTRIEELETQIRGYQIQKVENEATINQLQQDLAVQRNQVEFLTRRLEKVPSDLESRYHCEIEGLKDYVLVEQEEKDELSKKLQNLEKELLISRTKLAEHQRDSSSNQHVETLKQKIMKLRKENEVLKRKLLESKEG